MTLVLIMYINMYMHILDHDTQNIANKDNGQKYLKAINLADLQAADRDLSGTVTC